MAARVKKPEKTASYKVKSTAERVPYVTAKGKHVMATTKQIAMWEKNKQVMLEAHRIARKAKKEGKKVTRLMGSSSYSAAIKQAIEKVNDDYIERWIRAWDEISASIETGISTTRSMARRGELRNRFLTVKGEEKSLGDKGMYAGGCLLSMYETIGQSVRKLTQNVVFASSQQEYVYRYGAYFKPLMDGLKSYGYTAFSESLSDLVDIIMEGEN